MNSKSSKRSNLPRLLLSLTEKINISRSDKYIASSNLNMYYTWKNMKMSYKNNKSGAT